MHALLISRMNSTEHKRMTDYSELKLLWLFTLQKKVALFLLYSGNLITIAKHGIGFNENCFNNIPRAKNSIYDTTTNRLSK